MKTALHFISLFLLLCIGCATEVQAEDFNAATKENHSFPNTDYDSTVKEISITTDSIKAEKVNFSEAKKSKKKEDKTQLLGAKAPISKRNNVTKTSLFVDKKLEILNPSEDSTAIKDGNKKALIDSKQEQQKRIAIEEVKIRVLNLQETYETNKSHTLIIEVENNDAKTINLLAEALLPKTWRVISISDLGTIEPNKKKMVLISLFIPADSPPEKVAATIAIKNNNGITIVSKEVFLSIAANYDLEVYNLYTPSKLQAGETIEAKYEIKNKGNIEQEIFLSSKNNIKGEKLIKIAPNSQVTVDLNQETDAKYFDFRNIGTYLNVISNTSEKVYKSFGSTQVFPSKLKQKDAFFRYPVRASLNYNSHTYKDNHFSTISSEFIGDGYLDVNKKNYLNFIIRAPQQQNLKRFGVTDQYSLIYKYNNSTTVYLGDHAYYINRLGFDSRYGMGFKVDQNIKDWTLSAFYSKPRLYSFNSEALFGIKSVYHFTKSLHLGIAVERSEGTVMGANKNIEENLDEKGQIATFNFEYRNKNTFINAESSTSMTNKNVDYANYLTLVQKYKNLTYSGSFTVAGKNYFGTIGNSLQYSNSLYYKVNKFDFVVGQTLSQVNKRLDPLFFAAEPYYENYYGKIGYRFGKKNYINIRFDKRVREDQLEPKNYFYKEYGMDYRYLYSNSAFVLSFNGRIAKTQNLLSDNLQYRNTYAHNLNASYRFSDHLSLRGGVNHNYSNRYGTSNFNTNYFRYTMGFNYNFNKNFRFNATYNSGFSPEENYLRRDFINAKLTVRVAKNHLFELRANYYENPGAVNKRELLAFGKYTYSFGVPLKRILEQGGVDGYVQLNDNTIDIKGIKIIAAGKSVVTNDKGRFELNNLSLGKNYILMDESTLPFGIIAAVQTPFEVTIQKDQKTDLNIELVRSATVTGNLIYPQLGKPIINNLEGYLKLENDDFSYNVESNAKGAFQFKNIVPGTYKLTLIHYKGNQFFELDKETTVTVSEGEKEIIEVIVKGKERKIQFKSKNFKIGA